MWKRVAPVMGDDIVWSAWKHVAENRILGPVVAIQVEHNDAFLYGAGDAKIGSIVGGNARKGAELKARFLEGLPGLAKLVRTVQKIATDKGSLPGLDGRRLFVRSDHAALNTLLQGAGAVVMKEWLVIFDELLRQGNIPAWFVANVHDEVQIEVKEGYEDTVGQLGIKAFDLVTEKLGLRCPVTGEYSVGKTWADTH